MRVEGSQTPDRRPFARREAKPNRRSKSPVLFRKGEVRVPIDCFNCGVFDYYPCLRKLKEDIESDLTRDLSLVTAARVACLEPKYFSSFFRKKVGISFVTWRNTLRVNKAIEMMREADYSMAHVAYAAGFNDLRTFERAFKKYTGITPIELKKSIAPTHAIDRVYISRIVPEKSRKTPRSLARALVYSHMDKSRASLERGSGTSSDA